MKNRHQNSKVTVHCEDVRKCVLAHLDNEPDEASWRKVEKHLSSCKACAEFAQNSTLLNVRLREELKDDRDTAPLWARISRVLDAETDSRGKAGANNRGNKTGRHLFVFGSIAAAVMVAVFAFSPLDNSTTHRTPLTVTESINDFLTFKASGRQLDISSSKPLELRRWLVKRLDFDVPLSSAVPAGFKLAGARLCSFLNRRPAALMYHMGDKMVSMYVMTETGLDAILKRVPRNNELMVFSSRGLTNIVWRNDGLLYVVVADFSETEAIKFAKSVGNPGNRLSLKVTNLPGIYQGRTTGKPAGFLKTAQLLLPANKYVQVQVPDR